MEIEDELMETIELQDKLNCIVIDENWKNMNELKGKPLDWHTYIVTEAVELIESYDYKHWKAGTVDLENAKMELVDILHFINTLILTLPSRRNIYRTIHEGMIHYDENVKNDNYVVNINVFIKKVYTYDDITDLYTEFLILVKRLGFDIEEICDIYRLKNILNIFRYENGYREGEYIKMWDGKEDNEVLVGIANIHNKSNDEVFDVLTGLYKNVVENK